MQDRASAPLPKAYQVVTDRIVELLQRGVVPWRMSWKGGALALPKSLVSGKTYRGVNIFLLTTTAAVCGFSSPYWLTFKQARDRGGHVKKGEKSTPIVFWKMIEARHHDDDEPEDNAAPSDGEAVEEKRRVPFLRYFSGFNVEQCEGVDYPKPATPQEKPFDPIIQCEQIVGGMPGAPKITHNETRAFYKPRDDLINMPRPELFEGGEAYYSTLFHEMIHATGHASRLARKTLVDMVPFGTVSYAREELIAEMGAAFLCGRAGIDDVTLENSAAYIDGWLKKLKDDPKVVVIAAASAQKAADYILGLNETTSGTKMPAMTMPAMAPSPAQPAGSGAVSERSRMLLDREARGGGR